MVVNSGKKVFSIYFYLFLCLSLLFGIGLNVTPTNADVTDINVVRSIFPSTVRPEMTVYGRIAFTFSAEGPVFIDLIISIKDNDPDTPPGSVPDPLATSEWTRTVDGGEIIDSGEIPLNFWITAIDSPTGEYPFTWNLVAEITGHGLTDQFDFTVEILDPDSDPTVTIVDVDVHSYLGGDNIYTADYVGFHIIYDYCVEEAVLDFYLEDVTRDYIDHEGPVTHRGSGRSEIGNEVTAPMTPDILWELNLFIEYTVPDDTEVRRTELYPIILNVLQREDPVFSIYSVEGPSFVPPGEEFGFEVYGQYVIPEELGEHDIEITVTDTRTSTIVEGGEHILRDMIGFGSFIEPFTVTAPSDIPEDELWQLSVRVKFVDSPTYRSTSYFVGISEEARHDYSCDIVGGCVIVDGETYEFSEVADVTSGETFTVEVITRIYLPERSDFHVNLWDYDYFFDVIDSDGLELESETSTDITITLEARAPPINGLWNLRATAEYGITGLGSNLRGEDYYRELQVNVVDSDGGIEGELSDWAVTSVLITPAEPFLGGEVTFDAIIKVDTIDLLPLDVEVSYSLDGDELVRGWQTYEGGDFLTVPSPPWTPTIGDHTVRWEVDPDGDYDDPNRDNNVYKFSFTVSETPPLPPDWESPPEEEGSEEEFAFYITATPQEQVLTSSISYMVRVEHISGPPNPVQLEVEPINVPSSVSFMIQPTSGNPPYEAELMVTAPTTLAEGRYTLKISAYGDGKERYHTVSFIVEEGPEYQISVEPRSLRAVPGETVEYTVTVSSDNGYDQYVNLIVSGLENSITGHLEQSSGKPPFQTTLSLDIKKDAEPRARHVTVNGSGPDPKQVRLTLFIVKDEMQKLEEEGKEEEESLTYYLPLLYVGAIIAVVIAVSVLGVKYLRRRPWKPGSFCIECGKKIPMRVEFCPKCGAQQETK